MPLNFRKISRRKFIATTLLATPFALTADARWLEPTWVKVRQVPLDGDKTGCRLVHFSDLHHKGDCEYLQSVVRRINSLTPDFVCFTGDIMEDGKFLPEALEILSGINAPMFGVPGNHDYWSQVSFAPIQKCFAVTGGAWLLNEQREIAGGKINLAGITYGHSLQLLPASKTAAKNILLMHYPAWVKNLGGGKFDLMLAGHSHGGQVRIPFYGAVCLPFDVDEYDLGLFHTPAGPLYVNPGIGYLQNFEVRFNCRPEITVFEV
ncbi:MAG TPA: metallophosphoesterase [Verrucomicrobiae bacterium]